MSDSSKIFFLCAYWHDPHWKQFAGATVKIFDLAYNLAALGNKVTLFVPNYNFNKKNIPFRLLEIPFLNFPFLRLVTFNLYLGFVLLKLFVKKRPDVVYVRRMQSIVPLVIAKFFKVRYFFEINDDPYRQLYHSGSPIIFKIKAKIAILLDELNIKGCDKAFIITNEIRNKILNKITHLNFTKLITMNSGANTKLLRPLNKRECCIKIGLNPNKSYIGFLGTIYEYSGLNILISCAKKILYNNSNVEFLIFGDGPQKSILVEKTKNSGLEQNFRFFGQIDYFDLPIFLGATDICVAPFLETSDTNSATKIFDYLACGKPVIASHIENKENIFAESNAVYFVKPGDPNLLTDAIIHLLQDKNYANDLGKNGRLFIDKKYSREKIAKKIDKIADSTFSNLVN